MKSLLIIAFASALLCVLQSYPVEVDLTLKFDPENETELTADSMDISTLLEKANANLASREKSVIEAALISFDASTCIRFRPHSRERDYLFVQSLSGCYSFLGRRGGRQTVSLNRRGCVYHQVVQHEFIHALGFNHEQTRSDRDGHVNILYENIQRGMEYNFNRVNTNNLGTPYDYGSVMHYGRQVFLQYAFSSNGKPTIVPKPDPNVSIGRATQFSQTDIERINRLYNCSMCCPLNELFFRFLCFLFRAF
ncbi:High choriolytic enzyme 1 [Acipenser ruthenus]|uniref:Metalloendopeptidase n=1 Tax=Acipenser ruthenus TaxID=7906 RepID=A0A444UDR4_ACIRT|nr:High choriolytic enzyme 1 [Acipenser ruthenus]